MGEASSVISGLKITSAYKYILYVAGVILILSLFVKSPDFNNTEIRDVALKVIAVGLSLWLLQTFFNIIGEHWRYDKTISNQYYNIYTTWMCVIFISIQFIVWMLVFLILISPYL